MHRYRRRPEALERLEHETRLDLRADLPIDVVDAKCNQIVEIGLADLRPGWRAPGNGQRRRGELEALDRLPGAVLAARYGNQAVIAARTCAFLRRRRDLLQLSGPARPVDDG